MPSKADTEWLDQVESWSRKKRVGDVTEDVVYVPRLNTAALNSSPRQSPRQQNPRDASPRTLDGGELSPRHVRLQTVCSSLSAVCDFTHLCRLTPRQDGEPTPRSRPLTARERRNRHTPRLSTRSFAGCCTSRCALSGHALSGRREGGNNTTVW